jgi:hypothetical protein
MVESYSLAQPVPAPPDIPPGTAPTPPPAGKKYTKILLIGGVILGFIIFFVLGMVLSSAGRKNTASTVAVAPTEIPTITPKRSVSTTPQPENTGALYQPGKPYYDDTLVIITKAEPHHVLQVSVSRLGQSQGFTQYAKVNYFTGSAWLRDNVSTSIQRATIITNPLIRRWGITPTMTGTNRNNNSLDITIENKPLTFTIQKLSYDISSQSVSGFTKFNYFAEGTLKTVDETIPAYAVYTQTFAMNASDLAFLSTPEKLTGDWLVFWDNKGNAYYLDRLTSPETANPMQNYSVGVIYFADGRSRKLSSVRVQPFGQNNQFTASFLNDPQIQLSVAFTNILNKATSKSYTWQAGTITGFALTEQEKENGIGVMETIHK